MILSGVIYTVYFCLLSRQFKEAFSIEEVRWYFLIIFASALTIAWNIRPLYATLGETLRHSFFQVGTIITTTGFATTDFNMWPQLSKTILLLLMMIGACAGSTGGGIKVSRVLTLFMAIRKELSMMIHPRMVKKIKMDGHNLSHETLRSTNVYMTAYFIVLFVSLLIDCGANVDARSSHLVQFARMGSIYMEYVMGVKNPKVGLVNIGAEEEKGNALVKETYPLLKECKDINFIGNVEARDVSQY